MKIFKIKYKHFKHIQDFLFEKYDAHWNNKNIDDKNYFELDYIINDDEKILLFLNGNSITYAMNSYYYDYVNNNNDNDEFYNYFRKYKLRRILEKNEFF